MEEKCRERGDFLCMKDPFKEKLFELVPSSLSKHNDPTKLGVFVARGLTAENKGLFVIKVTKTVKITSIMQSEIISREEM